MKRAWQQINDNDADNIPLLIAGLPCDNENKAMNETILQCAQMRKSPFQGLKAKQHDCYIRAVGSSQPPTEPTIEEYWH